MNQLCQQFLADPSPDAGIPRPRRRVTGWMQNKPGRLTIALCVLALLLLLTFYAFHRVKHSIDSNARSQFASACDRVTLKIQQRLTAYALLLQSGKGLFAASEDVNRDEWRRFVIASKADQTVPGYQGIGYTLRIAPEDLTAHTARIRAEGFTDYTVMPPGERETYSSIIYLEPFKDLNLRAFGYDMFSDPVRRQAMEQAMDTGEAALSRKVTLVQETGTDVQAGTIMYVPIYRNGSPTETVEQKRQALLGWVYTPYRMNDLIGGIITDWDVDAGGIINLRVYDGVSPNPEDLLFEGIPKASAIPKKNFFHASRIVDFNGRRWLLDFNGLLDFRKISYRTAWATLAGGSVISALVFGLLLVVYKRSDALRTSEELAERIRGMAFLDSLTELPNRRLLADRLEMALAACKRSGLHGALMMVDLDNFKPLNDEFGHKAGDLLLVEVARRLRACVRGTDTVARIGGDEFVVLLTSLGRDRDSAVKEAFDVAEKIRAKIGSPCVIVLEGTHHRPAAEISHLCPPSIGLTIFDGDDSNSNAIIDRADEAMYRAKKDGRNRVVIWSLPPPAAGRTTP